LHDLKVQSAALREELDALGCVLENAERSGAGNRRLEWE
jgi:hypothetical protein